jgi:hypothetical protein
MADDGRGSPTDDEEDQNGSEHADELPLSPGHAPKSTIHGRSMPIRHAVFPS